MPSSDAMIKKLSAKSSVVEMQKTINLLERHKLKRLKASYIIGPVALPAILILFDFRPLASIESIVFSALIITIFISSSFYKLSTIKRQFKVLDDILESLSDLDK